MNKTEAYKFLNSLVEKYPDNSSSMLIDIIVHYLLFPNENDQRISLELEQQLSGILKRDSGRKIQAVKSVHDLLGCSLAEAKNYVETGNLPPNKQTKSIKQQQQFVSSVLNRIRIDYRM